METVEEMLREFMIESIDRVDNTDKTFPYLDNALQKTQKFEIKSEETPEEMLKKFFLKETEFWKNFANTELDILRKARNKMLEIYNVKR